MRLSLKTKLLGAFLIVLAPVLVLLLVASRESLRSEQQHALEAQLLTAQAVAVQIDAAFDAAVHLGRAVAEDRVVLTMDPVQLDPLLKRILGDQPRYDAINVFDANGINRGWGQLTEPASPRLNIADRLFFQRVMSTGQPAISEVIELRRPLVLGFVVSVPIPGEDGRPVGVINVVGRADILAKAYAGATLREGQTILLTDHSARLAFVTGRPNLTAAQSHMLKGFAPLAAALEGTPTMVSDYVSPLGEDRRMGAFVPTQHAGWVVGVTIPREVALGPATESFRNQLAGWLATVVFSVVFALFVVRYLGNPLMRLKAHARAVGAGELGGRVDIRTGDEFQQLGAVFNEMVIRLDQREGELKRAQVELVRSEKLAAVGELAAVVAHEVRNPLGVIFNAGAALRRLPEMTPESRALLDILQEEAERLNLIIGDLLDFARPLQPAPEPGDIVQVIREALASALSVDNRVKSEESYEEGIPPVWMDRRMMRQALINVVANAAQSMPKGGTLRVVASSELRGLRPVVRIELHDEGMGIAPEVRDHIFEPFFTTKATGTGLGLAVVKRIVDEHHGEIAITSSEKKGTTFTIWLPVNAAVAAVA
jgi:signal transduction histidine kinase